jgi:hypothetical protein
MLRLGDTRVQRLRIMIPTINIINIADMVNMKAVRASQELDLWRTANCELPNRRTPTAERQPPNANRYPPLMALIAALRSEVAELYWSKSCWLVNRRWPSL